MQGEARYLEADRSQPSWDLLDLEALLPVDHRARLVWGFAQGLDLTVFYAAIRARAGHAGRPPADPRVLLALWLYATLEGVGSARELDRLVVRDIAYRWLAGGVPMNYHGLADFRVGWSAELDRLLTESVTALVEAGLVSLDEIAVDGTKVRAPASSGSFSQGGRLARIEREAAERVAQLKEELEGDPAASCRRRQAAVERAAREARAKVDAARAALERLRAEKDERAKTHPKDEKKKREPSVSLTDLEARRMRFPDGSVRAGYNVQTVALPVAGVVVAVLATDRRNDKGLAKPMVDAVVQRYGPAPRTALLDEGYVLQDDVESLTNHPDGPIHVYMPPPAEKPDTALTPTARSSRRYRRSKEPLAVKDWRARMQTEEAKAIFGRRKLIERIHAHYKNRGLDRVTVRGLAKVQAVALWHALANNLMAAHRLKARAAAATA